MRQTGTLVKRYKGDPELDKQYLGIARMLLGRMKAALAGASGSRLWILPNSTRIATATGPHGDIVEILAGTPAPPEIDELLGGIVCIPRSDDAPNGWGLPEDEDNPIGTPGGEGSNQFWLRGKRSDKFEPEFKVKRHTEFEAGSFEWVSLDRRTRLTIAGPRSRYWLTGAALGPKIYSGGSVWLDFTGRAAWTALGGGAGIVGVARQSDSASAATLDIAVAVSESSGVRRYTPLFRFGDDEWASGDAYLLPAPSGDDVPRPFTMAPFSASATEFSFITVGGDQYSTAIPGWTQLVTGTVAVNWNLRTVAFSYAEGPRQFIGADPTVKIPMKVDAGIDEESADGFTVNYGGFYYIPFSGCKKVDRYYVTGNGHWRSHYNIERDDALPFEVGHSVPATSPTMVVCVDYDGDARVLGELREVASARIDRLHSRTQSSVSTARNDTPQAPNPSPCGNDGVTLGRTGVVSIEAERKTEQKIDREDSFRIEFLIAGEPVTNVVSRRRQVLYDAEVSAVLDLTAHQRGSEEEPAHFVFLSAASSVEITSAISIEESALNSLVVYADVRIGLVVLAGYEWVGVDYEDHQYHKTNKARSDTFTEGDYPDAYQGPAWLWDTISHACATKDSNGAPFPGAVPQWFFWTDYPPGGGPGGRSMSIGLPATPPLPLVRGIFGGAPSPHGDAPSFPAIKGLRVRTHASEESPIAESDEPTPTSYSRFKIVAPSTRLDWAVFGTGAHLELPEYPKSAFLCRLGLVLNDVGGSVGGGSPVQKIISDPMLTIYTWDDELAPFEIGGSRSSVAPNIPIANTQEANGHAFVQRRVGQKCAMFSFLWGDPGPLLGRSANYLYLDGARRNPVSIFGPTGENPRFTDIGSF